MKKRLSQKAHMKKRLYNFIESSLQKKLITQFHSKKIVLAIFSQVLR